MLQDNTVMAEHVKLDIEADNTEGHQRFKESGEDGSFRPLQQTKDDESSKERKKGRSLWRKIWQWNRYRRQKNEFKRHLIKYYKNKRSTVLLSPLVEEKDTHLAGFYVMPDLFFVRQDYFRRDKEEKIPVKSLKHLFTARQKDQIEIYLSAEAGFGKTSLTKYLAFTWTQASCPDHNVVCLKVEELKALAKFEFLFLVLLRESTAVCSIDEMISQQIIKNLPPSASQCPLQEILMKEKCLILLDGLDEWTHPDNGCCTKEELIPHRYAGDNCVILTTSRPWKLRDMNLETSDVIKKVELVELSHDSTRQLEKNVIRKMSDVKEDAELEEKWRDLERVIHSRGLELMQSIPILLIYITCLWCNNSHVGESKLEVYINIIELVLSLQKHTDLHLSSKHSNFAIPEYFEKHIFCKKFYPFLRALAELAYRTLFNEIRERTLVFDGHIAEEYLNTDEMTLSLLSGILTGNQDTALLDKSSKISFSHKTVQEFLAAIFISSQSDSQKILLEKCKNVQGILDMSMICNFLSQLNSDTMCEITADFMSVINEDEGTCLYRTSTDDHGVPLHNIQQMMISCLKEIPDRANIKLCLQDFFINNDVKIHDRHLQHLSNVNRTNIKSLTIALDNTPSSLDEIIELFSLSGLNNLQKLSLYGCKEEADLSNLLFPCLRTIDLRHVTWTNNEGNLYERLDALNNVQRFCLSFLTLSHEMFETMCGCIPGKGTLKVLSLEKLSCTTHDRKCTKKVDLSTYSQLERLQLRRLGTATLNLTTPSLVDVMLWNLDIGESSLLLSPNMVNIERLCMYYTHICYEIIQKLIQILEELPQTVTVVMCSIKPDTVFERVREQIMSSQTFVVLHDGSLGGCFILDDIFEFQTRKRSLE